MLHKYKHMKLTLAHKNTQDEYFYKKVQHLEKVMGTFLEMLNFAQWLFLQSGIEGFWI